MPTAMRKFFLRPLDDLVSCLERILFIRRPAAGVILSVVSMVVTWFIYVPIHELLHVLGCVITGGDVSQLEIAPQYGGTLLARVFPFVVSGGEYAGRLSGFDWKGNDLIYLATDIMPYLLSIFIGVPLLRACGKRRRPILFGTAIVLGFAPIYNIPGDYYEMGSILTTRVVATAAGSEDGPSPYLTLRSDDVFKLIDEVTSRPEETQVAASLGTPAALCVVAVGILMSVLLALLTYGGGALFARVIISQPPAVDNKAEAPAANNKAEARATTKRSEEKESS